jgi:hypothetical protein
MQICSGKKQTFTKIISTTLALLSPLFMPPPTSQIFLKKIKKQSKNKTVLNCMKNPKHATSKYEELNGNQSCHLQIYHQINQFMAYNFERFMVKACMQLRIVI